MLFIGENVVLYFYRQDYRYKKQQIAFCRCFKDCKNKSIFTVYVCTFAYIQIKKAYGSSMSVCSLKPPNQSGPNFEGWFSQVKGFHSFTLSLLTSVPFLLGCSIAESTIRALKGSFLLQLSIFFLTKSFFFCELISKNS